MQCHNRRFGQARILLGRATCKTLRGTLGCAGKEHPFLLRVIEQPLRLCQLFPHAVFGVESDADFELIQRDAKETVRLVTHDDLFDLRRIRDVAQARDRDDDDLAQFATAVTSTLELLTEQRMHPSPGLLRSFVAAITPAPILREMASESLVAMSMEMAHLFKRFAARDKMLWDDARLDAVLRLWNCLSVHVRSIAPPTFEHVCCGILPRLDTCATPAYRSNGHLASSTTEDDDAVLVAYYRVLYHHAERFGTPPTCLGTPAFIGALLAVMRERALALSGASYDVPLDGTYHAVNSLLRNHPTMQEPFFAAGYIDVLIDVMREAPEETVRGLCYDMLNRLTQHVSPTSSNRLIRHVRDSRLPSYALELVQGANAKDAERGADLITNVIVRLVPSMADADAVTFLDAIRKVVMARVRRIGMHGTEWCSRLVWHLVRLAEARGGPHLHASGWMKAVAACDYDIRIATERHRKTFNTVGRDRLFYVLGALANELKPKP